METIHRSIVKALSWRLLATAITTGLVLALTGEGKFAATVGVADTALKLLIYFGHERLWDRISFGRKKCEPEYHI